MFRSIFTFSFFTVISRISGLARDILIAIIIGATPSADVFFFSFRFVNLFRAFFAESGGFTVSFISLYSAELCNNARKAFSFASSAISFTFIISLVLCLITYILYPFMIKILAPRFNQSESVLTISLSRIMMPYIIFISISSLIGGMLQVKQHHFTSTAIAPVILNLFLIISLFMPYVKTPVYNLSTAFLVGGIFQLLLMLFSAYKLKAAFSIKFELNNDTKLFFKYAIPVIINNCITQIRILIDTIMASLVPNAVFYIYYADRLNQLPQGVIGTAIGTVLLPLISKQINDIKTVIKIQSEAFILGLILIMPIIAAFVIIPDKILLTLFSYGKFDYCTVQQISPVLIALSFSLPAYILNKALLPTFFANGNFKMPTIFSLVSLGANAMLNILLMHKFQHIGIAISTSISTWINSILLINYLIINKMYKISQVLLLHIVKVLISTLIMSTFLYFCSSLLPVLFFDTAFDRIIHLAALILLSIIIYFSMLYLTFMGNYKCIKV
ncbi:MAG: murein biosynthesis integral membrane protein MurJ [Wolbachia endosymbiont of Meromenopon meropis]|nr:murein biosynthesis integral membrane protein MurJ [Wolbachia endosymbiont of Meromenopon meropis]